MLIKGREREREREVDPGWIHTSKNICSHKFSSPLFSDPTIVIYDNRSVCSSFSSIFPTFFSCIFILPINQVSSNLDAWWWSKEQYFTTKLSVKEEKVVRERNEVGGWACNVFGIRLIIEGDDRALNSFTHHSTWARFQSFPLFQKNALFSLAFPFSMQYVTNCEFHSHLKIRGRAREKEKEKRKLWQRQSSFYGYLLNYEEWKRVIIPDWEQW